MVGYYAFAIKAYFPHRKESYRHKKACIISDTGSIGYVGNDYIPFLP